MDTTYYANPIEVLAEQTTSVSHYIRPKKYDLVVCIFGPIYRPPEYPEMIRKEILENVNKFQLTEIVSGMTSDVIPNDTKLQFQGARTGESLQLIDGVKTLNFVSIPSASMRSIQIYEGFIPAKYGDTNSGVVVIETLGYFDLFLNRFPED